MDYIRVYQDDIQARMENQMEKLTWELGRHNKIYKIYIYIYIWPDLHWEYQAIHEDYIRAI